ncbi:DNA cross-link repair protein pso2/snm1 [Lojkania enalia]|uniref:DNA cross-link repair protein pso2/snm1 n=1 Tax=Lojkania enalia TaxID=147567 RepID=A0A9P4NBS3_9PLEO|nr:DNA cross-link repair protein pso2/snm1 [Didymosphaeria enalia]
MFRNPRENRKLSSSSKWVPSVGRPPSPLSGSSTASMAANPASKTAAPKSKSVTAQPARTQTTLVPPDWGKKNFSANGSKGKPRATPNGNIMAFFKKAQEQNNRLFMAEQRANNNIVLEQGDNEPVGWHNDSVYVDIENSATNNSENRFNEVGGSIKRRRIGEDVIPRVCSPPLSDNGIALGSCDPSVDLAAQVMNGRRKAGPFVDDSDSEAEEMATPIQRTVPSTSQISSSGSPPADSLQSNVFNNPKETLAPARDESPHLNDESTTHTDAQYFDEFEGLEDEDFPDGEEYDERRWMEEQQRLEMAEAGIDDDLEDTNILNMLPTEENSDGGACNINSQATASCPICEVSFGGLDDQQVAVHVNACLDGSPLPLPEQHTPPKPYTSAPNNGSKMFKRHSRPARPGQQNPFQLRQLSSDPSSAFSKLMSNHAEDAAWATAAAAESAARGKPSYQRTCPFYKILPGFYICVDAFRYGAVKGQRAYFLSHFHSDHYIGLTSSWHHGPIYCSKVTGNLVRQQLRVDSKWVVDLEFEKKTEVHDTEGVHVTMIPANHCPGSSLFLFEKEVGKGINQKVHRVLHCGDFRACQTHIEHPLLRPETIDAAGGKSRPQKLDVCYLDTTYLSPKYAFPPQRQVIQACADMCVSLNKRHTDETDSWEAMKRERVSEGMVKFVRKCSNLKQEDTGNKEEDDIEAMMSIGGESTKQRGRLLVVVGTYSIGKERICIGIAKALGSKIYAAPNKQKICHALEDPELNGLLTSDPRKAQVHMTPLFEIRAQTLDDYLQGFGDHFSRAVAFRPSGWNYRPPNNRFIESPSVQTVLHSQNWKSQFSMRDLKPQPGSTSRASCFGVPYSEHSSFRELTMFCCALRIDKIIPTVNVGSAKSREKMKGWCEKWAVDKKRNGLFKLQEDDSGW